MLPFFVSSISVCYIFHKPSIKVPSFCGRCSYTNEREYKNCE